MKAILKLSMFFAVLLLLTASAARADGVNYFISGNGTTIDLGLPQTPTPSGFVLGSFFNLYNVSGTYNGQQTTFTATFISPGDQVYGGQWGLNLYSSLMGGANNVLHLCSGNDQGYSNGEANPFLTWNGDVSFSSWLGTTYDCQVKNVPEPSSLLLLGMGGAALLGLRRKRTA